MDIKHKAKDYNGNWVEGQVIIGRLKTYIYNHDHEVHLELPNHDIEDWNFLIEVDPKTVCVYTGKNDKDKKGIYTGDILVCKVSVLVYRLDPIVYCKESLSYKEGTKPFCYYDEKELCVTGNIHD